jgi:hypothetical protein
VLLKILQSLIILPITVVCNKCPSTPDNPPTSRPLPATTAHQPFPVSPTHLPITPSIPISTPLTPDPQTIATNNPGSPANPATSTKLAGSDASTTSSSSAPSSQVNDDSHTGEGSNDEHSSILLSSTLVSSATASDPLSSVQNARSQTTSSATTAASDDGNSKVLGFSASKYVTKSYPNTGPVHHSSTGQGPLGTVVGGPIQTGMSADPVLSGGRTHPNTGAIVGGVLGGVILLSFLIFAAWYHRRRKYQPHAGPSFEVSVVLVRFGRFLTFR